jgi:hypothetical protein
VQDPHRRAQILIAMRRHSESDQRNDTTLSAPPGSTASRS